jgi:hypothetical protein
MNPDMTSYGILWDSSVSPKTFKKKRYNLHLILIRLAYIQTFKKTVSLSILDHKDALWSLYKLKYCKVQNHILNENFSN